MTVFIFIAFKTLKNMFICSIANSMISTLIDKFMFAC